MLDVLIVPQALDNRPEKRFDIQGLSFKERYKAVTARDAAALAVEANDDEKRRGEFLHN